MNRESDRQGAEGDHALHRRRADRHLERQTGLGEGINLMVLQTPQYRQAMEVMHLNEYRWEIRRNFRDYAWVQYDFFQNKGCSINDANGTCREHMP